MICTSILLRASTKVSSGLAQLRHSSPSFKARQVCSHSNPSQKINVDLRCSPQRDLANQLPCALWAYWLVDLHTCQDGPNEEPAGRCQEPVDAEACREAHVASHDSGNDVSTGITTARAWATIAIRIGPYPELIGRPTVAVLHPTRAHRRPPSTSLLTISSTL